MNIPNIIQIKDVEGKGKGLFITRGVKKGTAIFRFEGRWGGIPILIETLYRLMIISF